MVKSKYLFAAAILFGTAGALRLLDSSSRTSSEQSTTGSKAQGYRYKFHSGSTKIWTSTKFGELPAAVVRVRQVGSGSVTEADRL